jgi:hypothetical protein
MVMGCCCMVLAGPAHDDAYIGAELGSTGTAHGGGGGGALSVNWCRCLLVPSLRRPIF